MNHTDGHNLRYGKFDTKRGMFRTTSADTTTCLSDGFKFGLIIPHAGANGELKKLLDGESGSIGRGWGE
jgi:hypothetical protein